MNGLQIFVRAYCASAIRARERRTTSIILFLRVKLVSPEGTRNDLASKKDRQKRIHSRYIRSHFIGTFLLLELVIVSHDIVVYLLLGAFMCGHEVSELVLFSFIF